MSRDAKVLIKKDGVEITDPNMKISLLYGKISQLHQDIFDEEIPTWYGSQEICQLNDMIDHIKRTEIAS
jgi:hypothetical protein